MPANTLSVCRPGIWGNPFVVGKPCGCFLNGTGSRGRDEILIPDLTLDQSIEFYRLAATGSLSPEMYPFGHEWLLRARRKFNGMNIAEASRTYLRGKNLACWCSLDQACHVDVLLEVANT